MALTPKRRRRPTNADIERAHEAWHAHRESLNLFAANGGTAPSLGARHALIDFARDAFVSGFLAGLAT